MKTLDLLEYIQDNIFIIAEIGKNFIQTAEDQPTAKYIENAQALIKAAKEAGADAVKFQTHSYEDEQLAIEVTAPHFSGSDRYNWVKRNTEATPLAFWQALKEYSDSLGITFFSTPMSRGAAKKLGDIEPSLWKVGSGDLLDFVMLDYLASTGKPIIISSGMSTLEEVDLAIAFLKKRTDKIILLHCVSQYPVTDPKDFNLQTIEFFSTRYNIPIGFSDHSLTHESALAAATMGAVVIEKHFSWKRDLWGSDHKVSLTPEEFKTMVEKLRAKETVDVSDYGEETKFLQPEEAKFRPIFRKSLMAGQTIPAGTVLTKEMIYAMRPQAYAGGLPSEAYESVLGKKTTQTLNKYDPITESTITA